MRLPTRISAAHGDYTMKMIKTLLFLLLIVLGRFAAAQEIPKWKTSDLQQFIAGNNRPTIISFWASFCRPCLEEIPYLQKIARKYEADSVQLVLVNLDMEEAYPKRIKLIASKFKIAAPIYFLDETNADVFCPAVDKSWSGAIPATLFLDTRKGYRKFFEDQLSEKQVESEIRKMLAPAKP